MRERISAIDVFAVTLSAAAFSAATVACPERFGRVVAATSLFPSAGAGLDPTAGLPESVAGSFDFHPSARAAGTGLSAAAGWPEKQTRHHGEPAGAEMDDPPLVLQYHRHRMAPLGESIGNGA